MFSVPLDCDVGPEYELPAVVDPACFELAPEKEACEGLAGPDDL